MRVPVYERREEIRPMPAPQVSPLEPAGDFGQTAANTVKAIADRVQQIHNDHEDARTLELFNQFKADSMAYHEDPEKGIYNTRLGFQSQGVFADADKWLRETGEKYAQGLKSNRAKKNFRDMARGYILQRGEANSRFEAAQMKKYREGQADAAIENSLEDIARNPYDEDAVKSAREVIENALELKYRYSSDEERKNALAKYEDDAAAARFNAMMQDDPEKADEFFKANQDSFSEKSRLQAENALEAYRVQSIVDELSTKFSPEREQEGLAYIRKTYSGQREERIASAFKTRSNERAIKEGQAERLKKLQQDELKKQIDKRFALYGTLPPEEVLKQYVADDKLTASQFEDLENKRSEYADRTKFTQRFIRQNPTATQRESDIAFMRFRGTNNETHRNAFTYCVNEILTGQADESILNDYLNRGLLTTFDVNKIKKHVKTLDDAQSSFYNGQLSQVREQLRAMAKDYELTQEEGNEIIAAFIDRAGMLDNRSEDYREQLQTITSDVLLKAVDFLTQNHGQRTEGYIWGKTDLGELAERLGSSVFIKELETSEILPDDVDLDATIPPASQMVQGTITGRFSDWRAYRKGQHNGIDVAAPEGTDIVLSDYGTDLTVSKVNTATPSKGGGNSVTLSGTYDNGDKIEVIISHMQNDSISVNAGDAVDVGTVIGKVGNTGMTSDRSKNGKVTAWYEGKSSGFHMDLKIKINGKYVDPETFTPPRPQAVRQEQNTEIKSLGSIFGSPLP